MPISSFNGGHNTTRIIASENNQDFKVEGDEGTKAINVAGTFLFEQDSIQTEPTQSSQAFLEHMFCVQQSILKELKIMNQHLSSISDLEELDIEPGDDSHGAL